MFIATHTHTHSLSHVHSWNPNKPALDLEEKINHEWLAGDSNNQ